MQCWNVAGVAMVLLVLGVNSETVHGETWQSLNDAGVIAYRKGRFSEAEETFRSAVKEAEKIGPQDRRLLTSLNNLALVYDRQGKYTRAEPLYKRSLEIYENSAKPARRESQNAENSSVSASRHLSAPSLA